MAMREPIVPPARVGTRQMSYEDYLLWSTEDKHAEWVNGEVIVHMPPTDLHQALAALAMKNMNVGVRYLRFQLYCTI